MFRTTLAAVAAALLASAAHAQGAAPAREPIDYSKRESWLCWPGAKDACAGDNTATVVQANGKTSVESWKADPKAPIDCFYVYPTVSRDQTPLSDMTANDEERRVAEQQVSRFGSKCRVFAPMYRQVTTTALGAMITGRQLPGGPYTMTSAYGDVVAAWNHYLKTENKGRGVVLISHSQGSSNLIELISKEIDGKPIQKQLVGAYVMGMAVPVEPGKDTGAFKSVPLCRSAGQVGCVVAFSAFRADKAPPANSFFGKAPVAGMKAACVNPANLAGGKGELKAYLSSGALINGPGAPPRPWVEGGEPITTPFIKAPGLLSAECVEKDGFNYLAVTVNADPATPRIDDIKGDLTPQWGLHLIDVNLVMGNLIEMIDSQTKAYLKKK